MIKTDYLNLSSKEFEANIASLPEVSEYVTGIMASCGCGKSMIGSMNVVVEEVFVNIASYAYDAGAQSRPVWVECGESEGSFYLVFRDKGVEYNPLEKADPVIGDPERMTIGGYGIYMVRTIADEVAYEYNRENGYNILTIKKGITNK